MGEARDEVVVDGRFELPSLLVARSANHVHLSNVTFRNARNTHFRAQQAAVRLEGYTGDWWNAEHIDTALETGCHGWMIEDVTVEWCAGAGIGLLWTTDCTLRRVTSRSNFTTGFSGAYNANLVLKDCEAVGNNPGWPYNPFEGDPSVNYSSKNGRYYMAGNVEAGGTKFFCTISATLDGFSGCDNNGPGCWFDWLNENVQVVNSTFARNRNMVYEWEGSGLFLEVNPAGPTAVRDNQFESNDGPAILIAESGNIAIEENSIEGYIDFRDMELRVEEHGPGFIVSNVKIERNDFINGWLNTQLGADDWSPDTAAARSIFVDWNRWHGNEPYLSWGNVIYRGLDVMSSEFGFETHGTYADASFRTRLAAAPAAPSDARTKSLLFDLRGRIVRTGAASFGANIGPRLMDASGLYLQKNGRPARIARE
jgi:hypothetical protein